MYWYNVKYQRVGHLFQDRFKSDPVDDDAYLLTLIRYIHQNPVKAGLCEKSEDYSYSSWMEYLTLAWLADVDFTDTLITREDLIAFHKQLGEENCLDVSERLQIRITDEQAKEAVKKVSGCESVSEFQKLKTINRDKALVSVEKMQPVLAPDLSLDRCKPHGYPQSCGRDVMQMKMTVFDGSLMQHREPSPVLSRSPVQPFPLIEQR